MRICVVGIGNPWASDDGVGPQVVERLRRGVAPHAPPLRFATFDQPATQLLDIAGDCDVLVVVDAVVSGAPAGTLHRTEWQPGRLEDRGVQRASSHGLGVHHVLKLGSALGRLPGRVILWGIEAASTEPGEGLSPDVAAALPAVVASLHRELQSLLLSC